MSYIQSENELILNSAICERKGKCILFKKCNQIFLQIKSGRIERQNSGNITVQ